MNLAVYNKFIVAASGFGAVLAVVLQDGAISISEGINLGVAALTAVGVFVARNATAEI